MHIKNKHNIFLIFLLTLSAFTFGQLKIDSVKTDSISCSNAVSGCVTIFVSGINTNDPYRLSIQGSGVGGNNQSQNGLTSKKVTFCNVAPGNYIAVASDVDDLSFSNFKIQPTLALNVSHTEDSVTCFGDTTGAIELTIKSGTGPFGISWSTGKNLTLATPGKSKISSLTTGTYYYSVVDSASGCKRSDTIIYPALDSIVPSFKVSSACVGRPITFTNTTFKAGSSSTNYTWNFGNGTPNSASTVGPHDVTFFTSGAKKISLRLQNAQCDVSFDSTITLQAPPNIKSINDATICNGDTIQLTTTGGINYSWTPATNINNTNISSPLVFPKATTDYIVAGTDVDACVGRDTIRITVNSLPNLILSKDTSICPGVSANLSVSGASTYTWSPATSLNTTTGSKVIATPKTTTTYTVTGTNGSNCKNTKQVTVTVNQAVIISPSKDTTICSGDTAILKVIGANSYNWTPSSSLSSSTASTTKAFPTSTTEYIVTGISTLGCTSSDTVEVAVSSLPTATSSGTSTICPGDSVQLTSSGGTSYTWTNGSSLSNSSISNPIAKPTVTTTYTVKVSNGLCSSKSSETITILDQSSVSVTKDTTICSGNPVQLNASGGNIYTWSPAASLNNSNIPNPIAKPNTTTQYIVQISQNAKCFVLDTVNVTVKSSPKPTTIKDTSICAGTSVSLFTSGGLEYTWSPNTNLSNNKIANPVATPVSNIQYIVAVDNKNGCIKLDTVNITVNPKITANVSSDKDTICLLDTVKLTASGGTNYKWTPSGSILSQGSNVTNAVPLSTTTYKVVVSGAGNCKDSTNISIVVLKAPNLATSNDTLVCSGDTIEIEAFGGSNHKWIPSTNIIGANTSKPKVFPTSGTYYVVSATTGGQCPAVDSVFVDVFNRPNLKAINDTTICIGSSISLNFTTPGTYNWSPPIEANYSSPQNPIFSPTSNRTYFLDFNDVNSCNIKDTLKINVSNFPVAKISGDTTLCEGSTLSLNSVNNTLNYEWSKNNVVVSNTQNLTLANQLLNSKIKLKLTNAFGCSNTDSVNVLVFNFPNLKLPNDTTICSKDTIKLNMNPIYSYSWSPLVEISGANTNKPNFFPSFNRQYIVNISDNVECSKKDTFLINTNALPSATITAPNNACFGDNINILGNGGTSKNWVINGNNFTGNSLNIVGKTNLNITLTTSNALGCKKSASKTILVDDSLGLKLNSNLIICKNDSVTITPTQLNLKTIDWSTGTQTTGSNGITFLITKDTTISAIGKSAANCSINASISINALAKPVFSITGLDSICIGQTSDLTITGNDTYTWQANPNLTVNTPKTASFNGNSTDTIIVIGKNTIGCEKTDSFIVHVGQIPIATINGDTNLCIGSPLLLSSANTSNLYTWSSNNSILSTSKDLTYSGISNSSIVKLKLENNFGCSNEDSVKVNVFTFPNLKIPSDTTICTNDTVSLNLFNGYSYTWTPTLETSGPNTNTPKFFPSTSRQYIATVSDNVKCTIKDTLNITTNALPLADITSPDSSCYNQNIDINGQGGISQSWIINGSPFTGATVSIIPKNNLNVVLNTIDNIGCKNSASKLIIVDDSLALNLFAIDSSCVNNTISVKSNGLNINSITWNTGQKTSLNDSISFIITKDTIISAIGKSLANCTINASIPIKTLDKPIFTLTGTDSICAGEISNLTITGNDSYTWKANPNLTINTPKTASFNGNSTDTIIVTGSNSIGCAIIDSFIVHVGQIPIASIDGDTNICIGTPLLLSSVNTSDLYVWSSNNLVLDNLKDLSYSGLKNNSVVKLRLESDFGCSNEDSVLINVFDFPNLSIPNDTVICLNDTITLNLFNGYSYSWTPTLETSQLNTNTPKFFPSTSRQYIVTVSDNIKCTSNDTLNITTNALPLADIIASDSSCFNQNIDINGQGGISQSWIINGAPFSGPTVTLSPKTDLNIILNTIDNIGCKNSSKKLISVDDSLAINLIVKDSSCVNYTIFAKTDGLNINSITWSTGQTTLLKDSISIKIAKDTTISVIGKSLYRCIITDTAKIKTITSPDLIHSNDTTICLGNAINLFVNGANNYTWSPISNLSNSTGNFSKLNSDTSIQVTIIGNTNGCLDTAKINVKVNPLPEGKLSLTDSTLCFGLNTDLDLTLTKNNPNLKGTYSIDGGLTYNFINSYTFSPKTDTTIIVKFRDEFNCVSKSYSKTIEVYDQFKMKIDTITFPECTGPPGEFIAYDFEGGTKPYSYQFNGNTLTQITQDTLVFNNLIQGLYNLYIEDANKCTLNEGINFLSTIKFDTSTKNISCFGQNDGAINIFNIQGGKSPYRFGLNQNKILGLDSTFKNLTKNNYTIFIEDSDSCKLLANFNIKEPIKLTSSISLLNDVTCYGLNDGEIGIQINGGTPNYTISGFDSNKNSTGKLFLQNLAGKKYNITIEDKNNCSSKLSFELTEKTNFTTYVSQSSFDCTSDQLNAQIDSTIGGSGNHNYSLDFGKSYNDLNTTNLKLTGLNGGIHTIITKDLTIGCIDTNQFTIKVLNGIIIDSLKFKLTPPTCIGTDGSLSISNIYGGDRPLNFELFDSTFTDIIKVSQADSTFKNISSGNKGLLITDNFGCKYQFNKILPAKTTVNATINIVNAECGSSNGGFNISFSGGSGNFQMGLAIDNTSNNTTINNLSPGNYTVYYFDEINKTECLDSSNIDISSNNASLHVNSSPTKCFYNNTGIITIDSVLNSKIPEFTYRFSTDSIKFSSALKIDSLKVGKYPIFIEQTNQSNNTSCIYRSDLFNNNFKIDSINISPADSIRNVLVTKPDGKEIDFTGSFWVHSITGGTGPYEVSFRDTTNWTRYSKKDSLDTYYGSLSDGTYSAFIKDSNSCIVEVIGIIGSEFNIPNIFTPNGDGKNEVFFINNLPEKNLLRIYDRWGALIYMHRNYDNTWDGNKQADGTYFYVIKTDINIIKGWVQIVR